VPFHAFTAAAYLQYRWKQKKRHLTPMKADLKPVAVILVTSAEEWERAYEAVKTDLHIVKV
jgi:uncharacterized protein (DUF169 family)